MSFSLPLALLPLLLAVLAPGLRADDPAPADPAPPSDGTPVADAPPAPDKAIAPPASVPAVKVSYPSFSADELASVVIIEGDEGVATGFVAKVRDIPFVVTNLHVLGANPKLAIKTVRGEKIAVQGIVGAVGADIALLRIVNPPAGLLALPLAADALNSSPLGGPVVAVGSRPSGGVTTQTEGKVVGFGPMQMEVDVLFQPGNSGSPIFNALSHEVLGVATYAETVALRCLSVMFSEEGA